METIYTTKKYKHDWDKYSRFWNEYRQDGDTVYKYVISETRMPEKIDDSRWISSEEEKQSWKIGDPDLPEWLNDYIKVPLDAENKSPKIGRFQSVPFEQQIKEIMDSGLETYLFEDNFIVFKEKSVEVLLKKLLAFSKEDVTYLVKSIYGKKRVTPNLIIRFKSDWIQEKVNYQSLLDEKQRLERQRQFDYEKQLKEKSESQKAERNAKMYNDVKAAMDKLIDRLTVVLPQISTDSAEKLKLLIDEISSSEVTQDNFAAFYRKANSILLREGKTF